MKNQLAFFISLFVIVLFASCGQNAGEKMSAGNAEMDTMAASPGAASPDDTARIIGKPVFATYAPREDSVTRAETPVVAPNPEGTLVYYCPGRMLENTDNNVSVTITKTALLQAIDQLERKVAATTGKSVESIHKDITGSSIKIAAKMKVELKYGEKDFETIYKPENDDQIFDGTNDMNWDWIIKPMKVGPVQLTIIVSAYDEKNGRWIAAQTPPKIFSIKVQVDPRGYFAKLWEFLETHPEWLFMQILIPLIAFFFGKRQGKKSE